MGENHQSSTPSETAQERRILTDLLYQLSSQWNCDPEKMAGKRMALLFKLREVGENRLREAVKRCCQEHISDFWPPQSIISTYIPERKTSGKEEEIAREREQARRKRLWQEGSPDILSANEMLACIKLYCSGMSEDDATNKVLELRAKYRAKKQEVPPSSEEKRGGEMRRLGA